MAEMKTYYIWRLQHGSAGWVRTSHDLRARSDKEAQSRLRRRFKGAQFNGMSLVALPAGATPSGVATVAPAGILPQLARAVEASDEGHDPFCMAILRGKDCSCGLDERNAGVGEAQPQQQEGSPK